MHFSSVLNHIGNTPLVLLSQVNPNPHVTLLAKIEGSNPGGSSKDRAALNMVRHAVNSGQLAPQQPVAAATSGAFGASLAMVGACTGHRVHLFMPEDAPLWYHKMLPLYGVSLTLTPAEMGLCGARDIGLHTAKQKGLFFLDQENDPENPMAYYETAAAELWQQTEGSITHLVAPVGTSGLLMGLSAGLKVKNPQIQVFDVQPTPGHSIHGLRNFHEQGEPYSYADQLVDQHLTVTSQQAVEAQQQLARQEGIAAGFSSGAAVAAAQKVASQLSDGVIVAVLPSRWELL